MSLYYYREAAGLIDKGPFSFQDLRELYQENIINNQSLVRKIDGFDWRPLEDCQEFVLYRERLIEYLSRFGFLHLDPVKFEEFVLKIFEALGLKGKLTPVTGDDGIDIELTSPDGKRAIAQCKRYNYDQTVGVKDVRELLGAMVHSSSVYGFFVTTSTYSEQAKDFANGKKLLLIDGAKLRKLFLLAIDTEGDSSIIDTRSLDPITRIATFVMKSVS